MRYILLTFLLIFNFSSSLFALDKSSQDESNILSLYQTLYKGALLFKEKRYDDTIKFLKENKSLFKQNEDLALLHYLMGYSYKAKGDIKRSNKEFDNSLKIDSILGDYSLYFQGENLYKVKKYSSAIPFFQKLIFNYPQSILIKEAKQKIADSYSNLGEYDIAIHSYNKIANEFQGTEIENYAYFKKGECLEKIGNFKEAFKSYEFVWNNIPPTSIYKELVKKLNEFKEKYNFEISPKEIPLELERIDKLEKAQRYKDALSELESLYKRVLKDPKNSGYVNIILLKLGMLQFNSELYKEALSSFDNLLKDVQEGNSDKEEILYWEGKTLIAMGEYEKAKDVLGNILQNTGSKYFPYAEFVSGKIDEENENYDSALSHYKNLTKLSSYSERALWRIAWIFYLQKRYNEALEVLGNLTNLKSSKNLARYLYWFGKISEKAGNRDDAIKAYEEIFQKFPFKIYWFFAKDRLNVIAYNSSYLREFNDELYKIKQLDKIVSIDIPTEEEKSDLNKEKPKKKEKPLSYEERFFKNLYLTYKDTATYINQTKIEGVKNLKKGLDLTLLLFTEEARKEFRELERKNENNSTFLKNLGILYYNSANFYDAQRIVRKSFLDELNKLTCENLEYFILAYPKGYSSKIESLSSKYRIDPNLVYAIILEESQFNPSFISPSGKRGLFGLLPSKAEKLAEDAAIGKFSEEHLDNPEVSIILGIQLLKNLFKNYSKDVSILSLYLGDKRAEKWVKKYGRLPIDEFIEIIPDLKTKSYIQRVIQNKYMYEIIYQEANRI